MDLGMWPIAVPRSQRISEISGKDFADDHNAGVPPLESTRGRMGTETHY